MIAEKSHNKNITRIQGMELFGFDPASKSETNPDSYQSLINYFQVKFACSVSVNYGPKDKVNYVPI